MSSRNYWCHLCQRSVLVATRDNLLCPICNESFVEEVVHRTRFSNELASSTRNHEDAELQSRNRTSPRNILIPIPVQRSTHLSVINERVASPYVPFMDGVGLAVHPIHPQFRGMYPTDTMMLGHSIVENGRYGGGYNVFVDNHMEFTVRRLPRDFGEFFLAPGESFLAPDFDNLIRNLGENDTNTYQGQPAALSAVDAMPTIAISSELLLDESSALCAVCRDQYELGSEVREMPCKHIYHEDCILPWLAHHNSCPVCRYEMPTEESIRNLRSTSHSRSLNASNGRASAINRGYRRLRLFLARPFRIFNSSSSSSTEVISNASSSAGSIQERPSSRDNR